MLGIESFYGCRERKGSGLVVAGLFLHDVYVHAASMNAWHGASLHASDIETHGAILQTQSVRGHVAHAPAFDLVHAEVKATAEEGT